MNFSMIVYIILAILFCTGQILKAPNKWLVGSVYLWIFSIPVLGNPDYTITIPIAGFDIQPSRLLFFLLVIIFILLLLKSWANRKNTNHRAIQKFQNYELWMLIYLWIIICAMLINLDRLDGRIILVNIIKLATFFLLYFSARLFLQDKDYLIIVQGVAVFAVVSSLVAVYQFFIDPEFFRIGVSRIAFGSFVRANGFLDSEYNQGALLALTFILAIPILQNKFLKLLVWILMPIGAFLTMHRMSWLVIFIPYVYYLIKSLRFPRIIFGSIFFGLILAALIFVNTSWQRKIYGTFIDNLFHERVTKNTLAIRDSYNQYAIYLVSKYPIGIGDYSASVYKQEAYRLSLDFTDNEPLIVHNGYLSAAVQFGVVGMAAYVIFLIESFYYHFRKKNWYMDKWPVTWLVIFTIILYNLTQDFSFLGSTPTLIFGLFLGASLRSESQQVSISSNSPLTLEPVSQA